jgi:opacity protein-like surface antigen
MSKLLLLSALWTIPVVCHAQAFEAWVGGGASHLTNTDIGTIDGINRINLQNGWRLNFALDLNTWRYFGHEIFYSYNRADWLVAGTSYGSAIHEGGYNFLAYAIPEGKARIRPYATGGVEFGNFGYPGYSATSGGGSTEFGYNYGAGLKIRVAEIIGIRFDFRRHSLGKPFGFPDQSGRLGQNEYSMGIGVML